MATLTDSHTERQMQYAGINCEYCNKPFFFNSYDGYSKCGGPEPKETLRRRQQAEMEFLMQQLKFQSEMWRDIAAERKSDDLFDGKKYNHQKDIGQGCMIAFAAFLVVMTPVAIVIAVLGGS